MQTIARQIRRRNATFIFNTAIQKHEYVVLNRGQRNAYYYKINAYTAYNDSFLLLVESQTKDNRKIIEANKKAKAKRRILKLKN